MIIRAPVVRAGARGHAPWVTFSRIVSSEQKRVLFEELEWGQGQGAEWNRGSREWRLLIKDQGSPRLCVPSTARPCLATGPQP